jgi:hypothetical protein
MRPSEKGPDRDDPRQQRERDQAGDGGALHLLERHVELDPGRGRDLLFAPLDLGVPEELSQLLGR